MKNLQISQVQNIFPKMKLIVKKKTLSTLQVMHLSLEISNSVEHNFYLRRDIMLNPKVKNFAVRWRTQLFNCTCSVLVASFVVNVTKWRHRKINIFKMICFGTKCIPKCGKFFQKHFGYILYIEMHYALLCLTTYHTFLFTTVLDFPFFIFPIFIIFTHSDFFQNIDF